MTGSDRTALFWHGHGRSAPAVLRYCLKFPLHRHGQVSEHGLRTSNKIGEVIHADIEIIVFCCILQINRKGQKRPVQNCAYSVRPNVCYYLSPCISSYTVFPFIFCPFFTIRLSILPHPRNHQPLRALTVLSSARRLSLYFLQMPFLHFPQRWLHFPFLPPH